MLPRAQWQNLVHLDAIKVLLAACALVWLAACWLAVMLHASCHSEDRVVLRMCQQLTVWLGCGHMLWL